MAKYIWCTLVMLGDNYACGAVTLATSIRNSNTKFPIWCMIDDSVSLECTEFLKKYFDNVIKIPLISHPCRQLKSQKQNLIYGKWIQHSFTKLNVLNSNLFPVDKVLFIDADTIFLENCDNLFNIDGNALTFSSPWIDPWCAVKGKSHNPYGVMNHGQKVNPDHIRAAFDNSVVGLGCVMLLIPDMQVYQVMIDILSQKSLYGKSNCISGFDEQLISETLLATGGPIYHIHQKFACYAGKQKSWLCGEKPKILGWYNDKPWNKLPNDTVWPDDDLWWDQALEIIKKEPDHERWFYLSVFKQ